jgi:hypothetical protein
MSGSQTEDSLITMRLAVYAKAKLLALAETLFVCIPRSAKFTQFSGYHFQSFLSRRHLSRKLNFLLLLLLLLFLSL